ncbi:MAG TPA: heat-inducible transcriptional repressor HrcA [Candidatus Limnocylindrales bacterium]|nr:heat-inducible transcriptional repressor HrcA [Candidatus Limnocylindrales bacterium]
MARRIRRTNDPLDPRASAILRAVIEEYILTAAPVGSQALVDRYRLGVSSATVRNILAELEAVDLLTHPHTSAGRVPTDRGYRWYVESVVETMPLPAVEQLMIRHQFGQVEYASEHWFRLAASTLASATQAAGLATPAKPRAARVRRIDLVSMQDRLASIIVVLREGTIRQILVGFDEPVDQDRLTALANRLSERLADADADRIEAEIATLDDPGDPSGLGSRIAERVAALLREYDATVIEELFSDGLLNVMEAPEFAEADKLRRIFSALEDRATLASLFGRVARAAPGRVLVFIGHENPTDEMAEVSLVLAPYGRPGRAIGVVGVLGPTRLAYPQAIGSVRFVSGLMNELVDHLYA